MMDDDVMGIMMMIITFGRLLLWLFVLLWLIALPLVSPLTLLPRTTAHGPSKA